MEPADRFIELINRPAAEAHLDLLVALVGASFDPTADIGGVLRELDQLADRYGPSFDSLMQGMFASGLLRGNVDDYGDPRNSFLHLVLGRRLGVPITLGVIAMEVGRRIGIPIEGIGLPGHFLVRHADSDRFADPFHAGQVYERSEVAPAWQRITGATTGLRPAMLLASPPRSIVLRILNNLKGTLVERDDSVRLAVLARLRGSFPELADEKDEHARWARHWN